ncbi:sugar ABC transporter ATP-binding protein [Micromonospora marina]|uniref:sugar ABC transporter ATP-binding protein n=1 Tax=Micromonospora marina TaxID=307120 RepID=UPI003452C936
MQTDGLNPGALLSATGIHKTFGAVQALSDARLSISPGSVVALAGENGSGKSTFVRILAGVSRPDSGTIVLDGSPVEFKSPRDALDAGICLVSQEPTLVPCLSVAENVLLPRLTRPASPIRRRALDTQAEPFLHAVGLRIDPQLPVAALPGGDRELVEVAKALATRPRLLVLDEVTARLPDPDRLLGVVDRLAADGMAVVIVTHRLREIRRTCDRAVVLRDGRNVAELGPGDLSDERITAAMVGRELREFFHKVDRAPGETVLAVRELVTSRSPHPIDVTVRAGEIVGIAGLVGSGRSELVETIAGVRRPRGGEVLVRGTRVRLGSPRRGRAAGLSLVPEDRFAQALIPSASIAANLALGEYRATRRTRRAHERRNAERAVATYGIRCAGVDAPVSSLSGGNAQKIAVAAAIAAGPAVLLLDEPTRGVDVGARSDIYSVISEHVSRGVGVLMASSDMLELLGLCDRILVLHEGAVVGELAREDATEETIALYAHGGGQRDTS